MLLFINLKLFKMKKIVITLALALTSLTTFAQETTATPAAPAEESTSKFAAGIDIVAPYLWRGFSYYSMTRPAVQPYASYAITDKLTVGTWATTNLNYDGSNSNDLTYNELDFYVSYQISPVVKVMLTDYYYDTPEFKTKYFQYGKESGHTLDLSLLFDFSENGLPLDFQINTLIAGNDNNADASKQYYSTYTELGYTHSIEAAGVDLRAFAGGVITKADDSAESYHGNTDPVFTNVGLNIAKEIKFSDNFSLPVFLRYTYNDLGNTNKSGEIKKSVISGGMSFTIK